MIEWCETKLDDESKFEFACPPDKQEFELVGERQTDGQWQCALIRYARGTVNMSLPAAGNTIASFTADSPDEAKSIAERRLTDVKKES